MGGESADRGPVGSLTSKSPVGFQSSSASRATLPEPEDSEDWHVWEVRFTALDGEDHAWLVVSGMIERDQINRHLLATDPDFREIGRTRVGGGVEPFIEFNRYPFDQPYQSQRFSDHEVVHAVAFYRASVLWADGMVTHGP